MWTTLLLILKNNWGKVAILASYFALFVIIYVQHLDISEKEVKLSLSEISLSTCTESVKRQNEAIDTLVRVSEEQKARAEEAIRQTSANIKYISKQENEIRAAHGSTVEDVDALLNAEIERRTQ